MREKDRTWQAEEAAEFGEYTYTYIVTPAAQTALIIFPLSSHNGMRTKKRERERKKSGHEKQEPEIMCRAMMTILMTFPVT